MDSVSPRTVPIRMLANETQMERLGFSRAAFRRATHNISDGWLLVNRIASYDAQKWNLSLRIVTNYGVWDSDELEVWKDENGKILFRFYARGIARGDRDHWNVGGAIAAGGSSGTRKCSTHHMYQQSQANRRGFLDV